MNVTINNFRSIDHLSLSMSKGEMIYVTGDSGTGKTTVFEAILWCLYGKVKNIEPWHSRKKYEVSVSISIDDGEITRTSNPQTLFFQRLDGETLRDSQAQTEIENIFQSRSSFLATSYILQGEKHPITSLAPKDRYDMMSKVGLKGQDPNVIIEKTKHLLLVEKIKVDRLEEECDNTKKSYDKISERLKADLDDYLCDDEIEAVSEDVREIDEKINVLESSFKKILKEETEKNIIFTDLSNAQMKLAELSIYTEEEFKNMTGVNDQWKMYSLSKGKYEEKKKEHDTLEEEMSNILSSVPALSCPTQEEISSIILVEKKIEEERNLSLQYKIPYDSDVIKAEIEKSTLNINSQADILRNEVIQKRIADVKAKAALVPPIPKIRREECVKNLSKTKVEKDKLVQTHIASISLIRDKGDEERSLIQKEYNSNLSKISSDKKKKDDDEKKIYESTLREYNDCLKEKNVLLKEYEKSVHVHKCPHCEKSVRYVDGKIVISDQASYEKAIHDSHKKSIVVSEREIARVEKLNQDSLKRSEDSHRAVLESLKKSKETKERLLQRKVSSQIEDEKILQEKRTIEHDGILEKYTSHLKENDVYENHKERHQTAVEHLAKLQEVKTIPVGIKKMTAEEIESERKKVIVLSTLTYPSQPEVSSHYMRKVFDWNTINKRLTGIKLPDKPQPPKEKNVTTVALRKYSNLLSQKKTFEETVMSLERRYDAIEIAASSSDTENELKKLKETSIEYKNALTNSINANTILSLKRTSEEVCERYNISRNRLANLEKLSNILSESLNISFFDLVNSVNSYLDTHLPSLFKDEIVVRLDTTKTLKSGKERDSINLSINYKEGIMNGLNSGLSGGECTRISTLLSAAFARFAGSKLLILDEATASIDEARIEDLLEIIKASLPDVIVIVTGHGHNHGNFDKVIEL